MLLSSLNSFITESTITGGIAPSGGCIARSSETKLLRHFKEHIACNTSWAKLLGKINRLSVTKR